MADDDATDTQSRSINPVPPSRRRDFPGIVADNHGISTNLDVATPTHDGPRHHPLPVRHMSAPAYQSPLRHHRRAPSRSKGVKETLNARSHYGSSDDDGGAIHHINQYIIKQEIGRGSFGAVHLATDQYGNEYAVKEFSKSRLRKRAQSNLLRNPKQPGRRPGYLAAAAGRGFNSPLHRQSSADKLNGESNNSLELIKEEIAIMKKLDHHNVVSLIEVLDDPEEDSLYMVLEMCKKGVVMHVGLEERAEPYNSETCRCWFRDMILGIEYLHAQGIIHRDIKPDNCLVTHDDVLKIVDFGVSEMFEKESEMHTAKSAGSPAFMPPELCVVRHGPVSGRAADIWSMGVTLYCLRYGRIPFEKSGIMELYESIRTEELQLEGEEDKDFDDLMHRIFEKDPEKRITMDELREHPWVTQGGVDPMMPAEENCATLVEPPTEAEMNEAITGNMAHLMVVMKAVKRFKKLLQRKRPQFMDNIFGRESRLMQPPHQMHGSSRSQDTSDRRPVETALVTEGVHRDVSKEISKGTAEVERLHLGAPSPLDSTGGANQDDHERKGRPLSRLESEDDDSPHPNALPARARTFPVDEAAKGHAHDPMKDRLFLHIGPGADHAESDSAFDALMISESPGGVDDDIYEMAYQEEINRILAERAEANIHLVRRVEHIEKLRRHPNVIQSSLNHAIDFAGTTARRAEARVRTGGLAALVRDARNKARETVAEAERSAANSPTRSTSAGVSISDEDPSPTSTTQLSPATIDGTSDPKSRDGSRSPVPDSIRLRDYARSSASRAMKGMARRIDETAKRVEAKGPQPYEGT
ncbi:Calcium/calmodulin-dependent protein kinase kinase cmkC [Fulvia fulva]|uniref:Calcium/calmodulin-dependent protein kinase kinase cmkC n=1 Tax=Passalora fulva TaxID=5499 RepID=A0A9Q8PAW8_PASFU|nr:Calcium/calmodulin-dependent protein kinase kinase cmkC [Fulvia fulva]KAK4623244.1 Calcium/calmodulin-dependent protein kinase kinase cmkC [Fulvia fulva]UJO19124.1 Calcium/calmodulin-dependent protein kinase kinase cmkC [Fulvia fulva]